MSNRNDSMITDSSSKNGEVGEEIWADMDSQTMASLYNQLGLATDQSIPPIGLEPSLSQGSFELAPTSSFGNFGLQHSNSMNFSYQGLNQPRRQTSSLFSRTLSNPTGPSLGTINSSLTNSMSGFATMDMDQSGNNHWSSQTQPDLSNPNNSSADQMKANQEMPGSEYLAPAGGFFPSHSSGTNFFNLVLQDASHCPSEFTLESTRIDANELDNAAKANQELQRLHEIETGCAPFLENLKRSQASAIQNEDIQLALQIEQEQNIRTGIIEAALNDLFNIIKSVVLDAISLTHLRILSHSLQYYQHVLEIYKAELQRAFSGPGSTHLNSNLSSPVPAHQIPPVVSLYITEQPLPQVVFKEKPMEEAYSVALLTGSQQEITTAREMVATLNTGELAMKSNTTSLGNNTASIDSAVTTKKATFPNLSVNISTRMTPISVSFGTNVSRGEFKSHVTSLPTYPFIVITNESQWSEAAGKLLMMDAFSGQKLIPWPQFANTFHSHFLKATRQIDNSLDQIERPLYGYEIKYIHNRFFENAEVVNEKQATAFWNWFGQCLQTIRFKRHINTLWTSGIVFGFMTKDECNKVLSGQGLGTFIIRLSESLPGLFGVAYVSDDPKERIKHCLVKNEDIGSNKSLPEFLRDKDQFQLLLRMDTQEVGKIRRVPKDIALQQFYSKKKTNVAGSNPGYIVL